MFHCFSKEEVEISFIHSVENISWPLMIFQSTVPSNFGIIVGECDPLVFPFGKAKIYIDTKIQVYVAKQFYNRTSRLVFLDQTFVEVF